MNNRFLLYFIFFFCVLLVFLLYILMEILGFFFIKFLDLLEKQDLFEKELDDNGIIWDLDDYFYYFLMEFRRFSLYGSEMKSFFN